MPKEHCKTTHINSATNKQKKTHTAFKPAPSQKHKKSDAKQPKVRIHPLDLYTYHDDVPITLHASPAASFTGGCERTMVEKMETKIANHLYNFNTPCIGEARNRIALGECAEDVFDTYMSRSMPAHLYKREVEYTPYHSRDGGITSFRTIIYEFQYPNFPSFDDIDWAIFNTIIDQTNMANELRKLGGIIPEYFAKAPYRCIASKLIISLDTRSEVYYVHLGHWVQKKCMVILVNPKPTNNSDSNTDDTDEKNLVAAWIDSF